MFNQVYLITYYLAITLEIFSGQDFKACAYTEIDFFSIPTQKNIHWSKECDN